MIYGYRMRYRILAWIAAVLCMPVVAFSSQIYPQLREPYLS